jgi:hypothetical protein
VTRKYRDIKDTNAESNIFKKKDEGMLHLYLFIEITSI